jgi:hypothetical protein
MQSLLLSLVALSFLSFKGGRAQIVDEAGVWYFFFGNYTSVFLLHNLLPSIEFHPVLGGADNTYIRYELLLYT